MVNTQAKAHTLKDDCRITLCVDDIPNSPRLDTE
jgi:hypothetical protein